jgi:hypothetical protein
MSLSTTPNRSDSDQQNSTYQPAVQLLQALWRTPYLHHQIWIWNRQSNRFQNIPVTDAADAVTQALKLSNEGAEVYFACAEYLTPDNRTAANASGAYAFWMDADCGEDKAAAGKGYPSPEAAEDALAQFCKDAGLPEPTHIVHSGRGLHVYWVLDGTVARVEWQTHGRQLKDLTHACKFLADDSRTADLASVLRLPGTFNHKYSPPRPVTLEHAAAEYIERTVMLDAIADAHARLCDTVVPKQPSRPAIATTVANIGGSADADKYGPTDLVKLSSALATLDPDCEEEVWKLRRLAPVADAARHYPELEIELYELARSWSSGELRGKVSMKWCTPGGNGLTGEQVFDEIWLRFLTSNYPGVPTTLGTVYYDAMQAGWVDPTMDPDDQFKVITAAAGEDE